MGSYIVPPGKFFPIISRMDDISFQISQITGCSILFNGSPFDGMSAAVEEKCSETKSNSSCQNFVSGADVALFYI